MTLNKRCTKCQTDQPNHLGYYGPDPKGRDGLRSVCRECRRQAAAKWRKENPESHLRSSAKYREANREKIRAQSRARYAAQKEILERLRQANGRQGTDPGPQV